MYAKQKRSSKVGFYKTNIWTIVKVVEQYWKLEALEAFLADNGCDLSMDFLNNWLQPTKRHCIIIYYDPHASA